MTTYPWHADAWQTLAADRRRLPHALLVHGPRGIGKRAFALDVARWLLCETPTAQGACGDCAACRWFAQEAHPDFRLVQPADDGADEGQERRGGRSIAVRAIREVTEFLSLAAHQGGWRVVLIHPAEWMNVAAANALLKTLEEPPPQVLLMLVSNQPGRLPATVLSRCRRLPLAVPPAAMARAWLESQAPAPAGSVLEEAGGAPLLAAEWANPERQARRGRVLATLASPTTAALGRIAGEFQQRVDEVWGWLVRWLYDLQSLRATGRVRYFPEAADDLKRLAAGLDLVALLGLQRELLAAGRWLRHPLNGQLLIESWLLRYAEVTRA